MWRRVLGAAMVAALVVGSVYLLRSVRAGSSIDEKRHAAPTEAPVTAQSVSRPSVEFPQSTQESEPPAKPGSHLLKDPNGAQKALSYIGTNMGSPAAKVTAIRNAVVESGSCADSICLKTMDTLKTRIQAAAAQVKGPFTAKTIECYQVGCIVDVAAPMDTPLQAVMDRLQQSGKLDWPVPAMYTHPTISKGTQSSTWILFNPSSEVTL